MCIFTRNSNHMKIFLLVIFFIISHTLSGQVSNGPLYFNSAVTKSDSLKVDSVWKLFKQALLDKDTRKVKDMSIGLISLSVIKPGESLPMPLRIGTMNSPIDTLFKIVHQPDFFQTLNKSCIGLNALAAYDNKKSGQGYENLDPVLFSIFFTKFPLGTEKNQGWSFAFQMSNGNIKFFSITQL